MNYQFPAINCINDVLPAIAGRDEFVVAQREWGTVINYMVSMNDTFPDVVNEMDAVRRECRGMLFYPDGRIMSRRLHKFFNVNERDETAAHKVDFGRPHVILEKLDGSMITPVFTAAGVRWGTKMGITDVSAQAEAFVAEKPQYEMLALWCQENGLTPIFEWCSRKQRIVVDYPEDRLVLIAVRDNVSGRYSTYAELLLCGANYDVPVVRAYTGTAANMECLMAETRATEGIEGWIIRFDNGQMLKVKGDWYVRIHKAKDHITLEKNVVDLIVNEKLDDVKSFILDDDRQRLEEFEQQFWQGIATAVETYNNYWNSVQAAGMDRKAFALQWMPTVQKNDPFAAQFVFGKFNGQDSRQMILDQIRKNTGTASKIDTVRHLWTGVIWYYHSNSD